MYIKSVIILLTIWTTSILSKLSVAFYLNESKLIINYFIITNIKEEKSLKIQKTRAKMYLVKQT